MLDRSHGEGPRGWSPHPEASEGFDPGAPAECVSDGEVRDGSVVAVYVSCDLADGPGAPAADSGVQAFAVTVQLELSGGRRVVIEAGHGFTLGLRSTGERDLSLAEVESDASLRRTVLNVLLPDDDPANPARARERLAASARAVGVEVTAGELETVPCRIVFSERARRWLDSPPRV